MRSLVIILVTLGLLLTGFFIYEFMQPTLAPLNNEPYEAAIATRPVATDNRVGIGPGVGVWIERHDPNTGRMSERFKGNHYDWNPDGTMRVETPQAEFFLDHGRIMRINGNTGNVVVEEGGPPGKSSMGMSQPAAPTRGNMKDVTIRLFEFEGAPKPMLTVTMDNATFDTQINRIYTEAATIQGKNVAADRIPVHMRGEDEDFDGWGLQIRWDQKQQKLQLLQIDHGDQLIIKHPNGAENPTRTPGKAVTQVATGNAVSSENSPAPAQQPQPVSRTTQPAAIQIYRASFQDNVHVTQASTELAKAQEMQVDFASEESEATPDAPPHAPSPATATEGVGENPQLRTQNPEPRTSSPTSKPHALGDEPIRITWTGKLVVTPFDEPQPIHADAHGQVIAFLGQPAVVRQKGTEVQAAHLIYGTTQEELFAEGSANEPVIMTSSDGARVRTQTINYLRKDARAILTGAGQVTRPVKSSAGAASLMTAQWSRSCNLTFFGSDDRDLSIHTADLAGDVKINHPQVKLNADQLSLVFAEPTKADDQSDLSHLHSTGSVDAVVSDAHGKSQAIQCQTLDLSTASTDSSQSSRYINRMLADGQVRASDADSEIRAAHLDATLIPAIQAKQPAGAADQPLAAVQLQHLLAQTNVHVRGKDGALADAETLNVTMQAGQATDVTFTGSPARVQKGQDITIGNLIKLNPKTQLYDVPGAGSMHLAHQSENNSPPTDVWWQSGLHADLNQNAIEIDRGVIVKTTSSDQTHNTATSDHLHITLADKPADKTKSPHPAKSDSLFSNAGNPDLAGEKEARSLTMTGNVKVQSIRGDDAGHLLTQFNLESTRLDYAIPEQKMTVPQAGKIFMYDNRKANAQPKPSAPTPDSNNNPMSGSDRRGMTAVKFDGNLVYDQAKGKIDMDKNVFLRHEPLDKAQSPVELQAQHMTIDLLKTGDKAATDQMAINHLVATDQVMFTSRTLQCQASRVDYTPATGIFIISGGQNIPARMFDQQGATTGSFNKLYYNSKTEQIERMSGFISHVRRGTTVPD